MNDKKPVLITPGHGLHMAHSADVVVEENARGRAAFGFIHHSWVQRIVDARILEEYRKLKQAGELILAQALFAANAIVLDHQYNHNVVTDVGINSILDNIFAASGGTHYFGLTDGTPTVNITDTMSSHAGWAEVTAYDESVRQSIAWSAASGKSKATSAASTFTIDTNSTTVGGSFIASNSTKGGTSGVLVSVAAFSGGDRALNDDDVLNVTATLTGADT